MTNFNRGGRGLSYGQGVKHLSNHPTKEKNTSDKPTQATGRKQSECISRIAYTLPMIIFCVLFSNAFAQSAGERTAVKAQQVIEPLKIGDTIPDYLWDYKMPLYKGTKVVDSLSLRDYKEPGKVLIIDFFTTWCGPCVESVLYVDSMITTHGYENIKLVSICIYESTKRYTAFASRVDWKIPTLFDWSYLHNPIMLRYDEQSGLIIVKDGVLQGSVVKSTLTKANMDKLNAGDLENSTLKYNEERKWRIAK